MSAAIGNHCDTFRLVTHKTIWGTTITINKALLPRWRQAEKRAEAKAAKKRLRKRASYRPRRTDSYNCRPIRGSSSWSRHAYGAAVDMFNRPYPEPVDVWGNGNSPPRWFVRPFKKLGFSWGGDWISRKDYPHLEWSSSTVPDLPKTRAGRVKDRAHTLYLKTFKADRKARRARKAEMKHELEMRGKGLK